MKLRILGNAIRLRLGRSEVEAVAAGKPVTEQTQFAEHAFVYCLVVEDGTSFSADFSDGKMTIGIPAQRAGEWATGTEVSLSVQHDTGRGTPLTLLIEKDFKCLSPGENRPVEDDEDAFAHPQADSDAGC